MEILSLIILFLLYSDKLLADCPNIEILPFVGLSNKASRCKKVDLPEPDGPVIAIIFPEDVYFLNEMPSEISISSILTISAFSIFITILASLFPSLAVVKIEPIKALKYE